MATATKTTPAAEASTIAEGDFVVVISSKGNEKLARVRAVNVIQPKRPKVSLEQVRDFYSKTDFDLERITGYPTEAEIEASLEPYVTLDVEAYGPTGHVCHYNDIREATGAEGEVRVFKPLA